MRIVKVIVSGITPLLLIFGIISFYSSNQLNITTYAQTVLRTAIETNGTSSFRDWKIFGNEQLQIQFHYSNTLQVVIMPNRDEMRKFFRWDEHSSAVGVYYGNRIFLLAPSVWIQAESIDELTSKYKELGPLAHEYTHLLKKRLHWFMGKN